MSEMNDILCIMFLHTAIEVLLFYYKTLLPYLEHEKKTYLIKFYFSYLLCQPNSNLNNAVIST